MCSPFSTLASTDPMPLLARLFSFSSWQPSKRLLQCPYKVDLVLKKLKHQWCIISCLQIPVILGPLELQKPSFSSKIVFFRGQLYFARQGSSLLEGLYLNHWIHCSLNHQTHLTHNSPCHCCCECNQSLQHLHLSYLHILQTHCCRPEWLPEHPEYCNASCYPYYRKWWNYIKIWPGQNWSS